jgi:virulence-associated protein VapD
MTLEQLKSLKVGDVVRYTNKEDASNTYVSKVTVVLDFMVELYDGSSYIQIPFDDKDINHIASTLALVSSTNELQIILHQIRDCEFDYHMEQLWCGSNRFQGSAYLAKLKDNLTDLRNKRDNLLKQNI